MKGGKSGRPRRGPAPGGAKKNSRPDGRKGASKRSGRAHLKKGGKPPREFGGFTTASEE